MSGCYNGVALQISTFPFTIPYTALGLMFVHCLIQINCCKANRTPHGKSKIVSVLN
jgi:hypothetical protein